MPVRSKNAVPSEARTGIHPDRGPPSPIRAGASLKMHRWGTRLPSAMRGRLRHNLRVSGRIERAPGRETWSVRKPALESAAGIVASQHYAASEVGARVLAEGGNAVDAAVSAGLAIGTVEPWMSGLGGGGFMVVYEAAARRAWCIEFGMRASTDIDPDDYPLRSGSGTDSDLFAWPVVEGDRNVSGPLSVAVPGFVAGHALALERFGTRSWAEALGPAIRLARRGMDVDWYATLKIASEAPALARDAESARVFLSNGQPPAAVWGGSLPSLRLGELASTLTRLAEAGPRDFYEGEIACALIADARALGVRLNEDDLRAFRARLRPADTLSYRGSTVHASTGLSAGPTLRHALSLLAPRLEEVERLDARAYLAYADVLSEAYRHRLESLGEGADPGRGCTTHLSVVDGQGNMVALTQTLLSLFGSKVTFPCTGVLMNNGIMWFDPRPGRPNSIAPGRRPLSNMCPVVAERKDGFRVAAGASGGRRILPAVFQLLSFMLDFRLSVEEAVHQPRLDASGEPVLDVDEDLGEEVIGALAGKHSVRVSPNSVYPSLFACPNVVARDEARGINFGGAFVMSPWARAVMGK